jgi:hypothetical protein
MKRWAIVTVLLYALALLLLTPPTLLLALGEWWGRGEGIRVSWDKAFDLFREWQYWLWLGVMVVGQFLLLLVPVDIAARRLTPRRKLRVPVVTSAFFFASLVAYGLFSVACAAFGDNAFRVLEVFGEGDWPSLAVVVLVVGALWIVWGVAFYRMTRANEPADAAARLTRVLLKGSIAELLIAISSHIIVRHRDVCCAPAASFWGIATGISVLLLCFGPGVFFLFAERIARKQPKPPSA